MNMIERKIKKNAWCHCYKKRKIAIEVDRYNNKLTRNNFSCIIFLLNLKALLHFHLICVRSIWIIFRDSWGNDQTCNPPTYLAKGCCDANTYFPMRETTWFSGNADHNQVNGTKEKSSANCQMQAVFTHIINYMRDVHEGCSDQGFWGRSDHRVGGAMGIFHWKWCLQLS